MEIVFVVPFPFDAATFVVVFFLLVVFFFPIASGVLQPVPAQCIGTRCEHRTRFPFDLLALVVAWLAASLLFVICPGSGGRSTNHTKNCRAKNEIVDAGRGA